MGARAGRKGSRTYNILTCGKGSWRKYLDKRRRKAAKQFAIDEELKAWQQAAADAYYRVEKELQEWDRPCVEHSNPKCPCNDPDYARVMYENGFDQRCICGLLTPDPKACICGCGYCCPPDCDCEEEDNE